MKILVFYTPRSKSTAIHNALAKHYSLEPWCDMVTQSRIKNQNFDEYPGLIDKINTTDDICVKLNGNDFIDLQNRQVLDFYKKIDFGSFDKILITTRSNIAEAIASYAYMNPADKNTWHRPRGVSRIGGPYQISLNKVFYLLRGYVVYNIICDYIRSQVPAEKILVTDYETAEADVKDWFNVDMSDIDIEPNGYDYKTMAENYSVIKSLAHEIHEILATYDLLKIADKESYFWKTTI